MEIHSRCLFFSLGIYNHFFLKQHLILLWRSPHSPLEKPSFSGHVVLEGQTSSPPHAQVHSDLIREAHMAQICPGRARPGASLLQLMGKKRSFSTEAAKWSTAYKLRVSVGWGGRISISSCRRDCLKMKLTQRKADVREEVRHSPEKCLSSWIGKRSQSLQCIFS